MPTGYTAVIDDNPTVPFRHFALRCARAFGALVTMLPEKMEPSPYYRERLEKANAELAEALGLTLEAAEVLMLSERESVARRNAEHRQEHATTAAAYERMRVEVAAWKPPTKDHENMKQFMLEQLHVGGPGSEPYQVDEGIVSAQEWLAKRIAYCAKEVERAAEGLAEEEERCRVRTAWIQALVASLPGEESTRAATEGK
jgi:hypothetical protein